jgi:hypothetical protein
MSRKQIWALACLAGVAHFVFTYVAPKVGDMVNPPAPTTTTTTVPALDCVHAVINLDTGVVTESPVPCRQPETSGCSGSVSFRIEEDGSVTSWCGEEVSK